MNLFNLEPLQSVGTGSRDATNRERDAYLREIAERRGIQIADSAHFNAEGVWTCYGKNAEQIIAELETIKARMQRDADRGHGETVKAQREAATWQRRALSAGWKTSAAEIHAIYAEHLAERSAA